MHITTGCLTSYSSFGTSPFGFPLHHLTDALVQFGQKGLGIIEVGPLLFLVHLVKGAHQHAQSVIFEEKIALDVHKEPE